MCVAKNYIMSIQLKKPGHTWEGKGVDYVNGSNRYQRHLSAEQLSNRQVNGQAGQIWSTMTVEKLDYFYFQKPSPFFGEDNLTGH